MSQNDVKVFLPCRAGSERVPHKNTRPFAEWQNGLLELKLAALEGAAGISQIILDSNDEKVLDYGRTRQSNWSGTAELCVQERPNHLGLSSTTTDACWTRRGAPPWYIWVYPFQWMNCNWIHFSG